MTSKHELLISMVAGLFVLLGSAACDGSDDLRNIERGRDNPPAIDASPPDEAN